MERKFFIKVSYLFIFLTWVISFDSLAIALPCYKNFQDSDVITTKIKLGYWKSKTYIKDYDYLWYEDALSASLGFNPLHSVKFLQNLYINLQTDLIFSSDIQNNNIF